jgi:predicted ArsR family transcriptional regulator
VAVSLPPRHYNLAGRLLSGAVEQAERSGQSPRAILDQRAYKLGRQLGEAAHAAAGHGKARDTALRVLEAHGFQPRLDAGQVTLVNCPFHTLAQEYTDTVCGTNLSLLTGLLDGVGTTGLTARLDPTPPFCCVRLDPTAAPSPDLEP